MTELEEKMYKNGLIKLSHTLNKGITPINTIVLSRLLVERDYAIENEYITEDGFFIADGNELSKHTNLSEDNVGNVINNLIRRKLIQAKKNDDFCLIRIDDEKIIEVIEEFEHDYPDTFGNWDKGLKKVQKAILKLDLIRKENSDDTSNTDEKISGHTVARNTENDNSDNISNVPELSEQQNNP